MCDGKTDYYKMLFTSCQKRKHKLPTWIFSSIKDAVKFILTWNSIALFGDLYWDDVS